jgi:hypothetical protein
MHKVEITENLPAIQYTLRDTARYFISFSTECLTAPSVKYDIRYDLKQIQTRPDLCKGRCSLSQNQGPNGPRNGEPFLPFP